MALVNRGDQLNFKLTKPSDKVYSSDEEYRFLVHVVLGAVEQRAMEMGSKTKDDRRLMTSLISNNHQGTFLGWGGLVVAEPAPRAVTGISRIDVGGEIQPGQMDSIESILTKSPPSEYNQVDIRFSICKKPIGILLKQTKDGKLLGSAHKNEELIKYAESANLPIIRIEVSPSQSVKSVNVELLELHTGTGTMLTVDIPNSDKDFYRVQVLNKGLSNKGVYYASGDTKRTARTMKINRYGEMTQNLTKQELNAVITYLNQLMDEQPDKIDKEDLEIIQQEQKKLSFT
ncbi:hypothetical protein H6800_02255 [Candidatus Nomurabacteria bacterium]|nr:hypothetical protein [Candidatus Nomurabacteria bacterium]